MSFDLNLKPNDIDENALKPVAAAAMGAYYYRKLLVMVFLINLCGALIFFFALAAVSEQLSKVLFVVLAIALPGVFFVFYIWWMILLYKSSRAFCRIREEIVPNAKSTITRSWIAFFISSGILIFVQSILPDLVFPTVLVTPTFVKTLSPTSMTEWYILLVILIPAIYSFGVFALFIYRIKQKFVPDKIPSWLAALFFVCLYPVAIYCYVDKIYRFFSNQFGYKAIEKIYIP